MFNGTPIYIATNRMQKRKHRKKRINKKWIKRYGYHEQDFMPHGEMILFEGALWMTQKTFEEVRTSFIN